MVSYRILVGSYKNSVSTLEFDATSKALKVVASTDVGFHPSWLTRHAEIPSLVFSGLEESNGTIIALEVTADGRVTKAGEAQSGGGDPASLFALKDEVVVGNYSSGNLSAISISPNSPYFGAPKETLTFPFSGAGPNADRQEASHPHHVVYIPERDELLVPDLGADKTWRLSRSGGSKWMLVGHVEYTPGSGPRHVAYHDGVLYSLLELTSSVATHRLPPLPAPATLHSITYSMLHPPEPIGDMLAAEITLYPPPSGSSSYTPRYLYVSNRNAPSSAGDPLAIFSLADRETPQLVKEVPTGLRHVRGMVVSPDGRFVIVGGVHGGGAKVYVVKAEGAELEEVAQCEIEAPTHFLWL